MHPLLALSAHQIGELADFGIMFLAGVFSILLGYGAIPTRSWKNLFLLKICGPILILIALILMLSLYLPGV